MKKVMISLLTPFRNFFKQLAFVMLLTALLCVLFNEGNNILKAEALAMASVVAFFFNIKLIFSEKEHSEVGILLCGLSFSVSCILLGLLTYWLVGSSDELAGNSFPRYADIGLMVGILFTNIMCVSIGLLKEFSVLKPLEEH
jgi:hypothetical protein